MPGQPKYAPLRPGPRRGFQEKVAKIFRDRPRLLGGRRRKRFRSGLINTIRALDPYILHNVVLPREFHNKGEDPVAWKLRTRKAGKGRVAYEIGDSVALTHIPTPHTREAWGSPGGGNVDFRHISPSGPVIVVHEGKLSVYLENLRSTDEKGKPTHRVVARYLIDPSNRRLNLVTERDVPARGEVSRGLKSSDRPL